MRDKKQSPDESGSYTGVSNFTNLHSNAKLMLFLTKIGLTRMYADYQWATALIRLIFSAYGKFSVAWCLIPDCPLNRHSGVGRNPTIKDMPRSGQNQGIVPLTWGFFNQLDSGLRRNGAVLCEWIIQDEFNSQNWLVCPCINSGIARPRRRARPPVFHPGTARSI